MLLVVQKRFAIFAILFGIAAGYYRQGAGRKDPGRERADPRQDRQDAKWAAEKLNAPPSPYGHYCIGLNKHIKDGDEIFQHYQLMFS